MVIPPVDVRVRVALIFPGRNCRTTNSCLQSLVDHGVGETPSRGQRFITIASTMPSKRIDRCPKGPRSNHNVFATVLRVAVKQTGNRAVFKDFPDGIGKDWCY